MGGSIASHLLKEFTARIPAKSLYQVKYSLHARAVDRSQFQSCSNGPTLGQFGGAVCFACYACRSSPSSIWTQSSLRSSDKPILVTEDYVARMTSQRFLIQTERHFRRANSARASSDSVLLFVPNPRMPYAQLPGARNCPKTGKPILAGHARRWAPQLEHTHR
jgi:hypothetical protein